MNSKVFSYHCRWVLLCDVRCVQSKTVLLPCPLLVASSAWTSTPPLSTLFRWHAVQKGSIELAHTLHAHAPRTRACNTASLLAPQLPYDHG